MPENPYERQAIFHLQRYLRQLSRFDPDIPSVQEDGIFGEETQASLMAFQKKYGLPITGTADPQTWATLFEAYLADVESRTRPSPVFLFPRHPPDYSVGEGDTGPLVSVIQWLLYDIVLLYGLAPDVIPLTGVYDQITTQAVRDFQRVNGLPQDGRVDRITWNYLADAADRREEENT